MAKTTNLRLLSEAAELMAGADAAENPAQTAEELAAYYTGQARTLVARQLVVPAEHRGSGRNARALVDDEGMCRIRVLSELLKLGLVPQVLKYVPRLLNNLPDTKPGKVEPVGFKRVVEGIASGETDWSFALHIMRDGSAQGACSRKPVKPNELRDGLRVATIELPLNTILGPLLRD